MITLPNVKELKRITQSLATLDLIICSEWEDRYYSYDSEWSDTEDMASMRNGCGDDWFILFHSSGAAGIKGLAHEYPAAQDPELVEQIRQLLPPELSDFAKEPAFHWDSTSFCYWRLTGDTAWSETPEQSVTDSGADEFLEIFANPLTGYLQFSSDYFEKALEQEVVEHILKHKPVTPEIVASLNSEIGIDDIREDLVQIGYPH